MRKNFIVNQGRIESVAKFDYLENGRLIKKPLIFNGTADGSSGLDQVIDTLTYIIPKIHQMKYYTIDFAKVLPVKAGQGAWFDTLFKFTSNDASESFNNMNLKGNPSGLTSQDVQYNKVVAPSVLWNPQFEFNVMQVEQASVSSRGAANLIEDKITMIKKNWDIGIQKTFMFGNAATNMDGLATITGATLDTTLITTPLRLMTDDQFVSFVSELEPTYTNNSTTRQPLNALAICNADYMSLGRPMNAFGYRSRLEYLEMSLSMLAGEKVQIYPVAYYDATYIETESGFVRPYAGDNIMVAYRNDPEVFEFNLPIPLFIGNVFSINGFRCQGGAGGQYSGALTLEPSQITIFTYPDA